MAFTIGRRAIPADQIRPVREKAPHACSLVLFDVTTEDVRKAVCETFAVQDAPDGRHRVGRDDGERAASRERSHDVGHPRYEFWIVLALQEIEEMPGSLARLALVSAVFQQPVKHVVLEQAKELFLAVDTKAQGSIRLSKDAPRRFPGLHQRSVEIEEDSAYEVHGDPTAPARIRVSGFEFSAVSCGI